MSLFQCENCGCCENTNLTNSAYPTNGSVEWFCWDGLEELKGMKLCSACSPATYDDGTESSKGGKWHNKFKRVFLPKGMFFTNKQGDLEHKETGSTRFYDYAIDEGTYV